MPKVSAWMHDQAFACYIWCDNGKCKIGVMLPLYISEDYLLYKAGSKAGTYICPQFFTVSRKPYGLESLWVETTQRVENNVTERGQIYTSN